MTNTLKNRDSSLDLIRIEASFFLVAYHFFLYAGFYRTDLSGPSALPVYGLYHIVSICIPLFMLLTGYLMNQKKLSLSYYAGISRTLVTYVLASILTLVFRRLQGEHIPLPWFLLNILNFSGSPYSWYIEMYIGLFLLIPFLNMLYHAAEEEHKENWLLLTMIILTALPSTLNILRVSRSQFIQTLLTVNGDQKLLPAYWIPMYPVTYYFLGCWLSRHQPKIRSSILLALLFCHILLMSGFSYLRNAGAAYEGDAGWQVYSSLSSMISTALIFLIGKNINTAAWHPKLKLVLKYVSGLCLGIYLLSWITDSLIYPRVINRSETMLSLFVWQLPVSLVIFVSSGVLSACIELCQRCLFRLFHLVFRNQLKS